MSQSKTKSKSKSKTSNQAIIETTPREGTGSRDSRRLRREGKVPVNLFGHEQGNQNLCVDAHNFEMVLNTAAQVFTLKIGKTSESCLLTELQYDTFGQKILHADFTRVDLSEEVEVEVQLEFVGHAKGVAEGGTLAVQHPTVAVKCRADSIPEMIEVDVVELDLGQVIHAGEMTLPPGVSLDTHKMEADVPIVGVVAPQAEEPTETEEGAEPEVVGGDGEATPAEGGDGDSKGEPKKDES